MGYKASSVEVICLEELVRAGTYGPRGPCLPQKGLWTLLWWRIIKKFGACGNSVKDGLKQDSWA